MTTSFDAVANLYDEVRPSYPPAIVDAVTTLTAVPAGGRVLEIGCGSGQMTLPLAARGYRIVGLEPGPALAAIAERKCQGHPHVTIVRERFEDWGPESAAFDVVLSAQAFHWIYDRFFPDDGAVTSPAVPDLMAGHRDAVAHSPAFTDMRSVTHPWQRRFPGAEYLKLVGTHSPTRALSERDRSAFLDAIAGVLARHGDTVTRTYLTTVLVARRTTGGRP